MPSSPLISSSTSLCQLHSPHCPAAHTILHVSFSLRSCQGGLSFCLSLFCVILHTLDLAFCPLPPALPPTPLSLTTHTSSCSAPHHLHCQLSPSSAFISRTSASSLTALPPFPLFLSPFYSLPCLHATYTSLCSAVVSHLSASTAISRFPQPPSSSSSCLHQG